MPLIALAIVTGLVLFGRWMSWNPSGPALSPRDVDRAVERLGWLLRQGDDAEDGLHDALGVLLRDDDGKDLILELPSAPDAAMRAAFRRHHATVLPGGGLRVRTRHDLVALLSDPGLVTDATHRAVLRRLVASRTRPTGNLNLLLGTAFSLAISLLATAVALRLQDRADKT